MEPALELSVSKQDADFGVIEGMERAVGEFWNKKFSIGRFLIGRLPRNLDC